MKLHTYRHPEWLTNTYLVLDEQSKDAVLVDAGAPYSFFEPLLRSSGAQLHAILLTHTHHDHIDRLDEWKAHSPLPLIQSATPVDLNFGTVKVQVIKTPGHCAEHLCFAIAECGLFTGDLLFKGSVGGTRNGPFEELRTSILKLLNDYGDDVAVFPGHSDATTIGDERAHNPFVRYLEGNDTPLHTAIVRGGRPFDVLVQATDYDGERKFLVADKERGRLAVVAE